MSKSVLGAASGSASHVGDHMRTIVADDSRRRPTVANAHPRSGQMAMIEPSPDQAAARIEDGVKTYGAGDAEIRALDGVTRSFPAGRFAAIMGPSGSGKSTLIHCMAGLDRL